MAIALQLQAAMFLKAWQFITLVLTTLLIGMSFSHVLEMPGKFHVEASLWLAFQHTLYRGFAIVGGPIEIGAIVSMGVLAFIVRADRASFAPHPWGYGPSYRCLRHLALIHQSGECSNWRLDARHHPGRLASVAGTVGVLTRCAIRYPPSRPLCPALCSHVEPLRRLTSAKMAARRRSGGLEPQTTMPHRRAVQRDIPLRRPVRIQFVKFSVTAFDSRRLRNSVIAVA